MRGLGFGSWLVLMACTAPNPGYQLEDGGEAGESGPSDDTTGAVTETGADGESTGLAACELHDPRPLEITVEGPELQCGSVVWLGVGTNLYFPETTRHMIDHYPCQSDSCANCNPPLEPTYHIDLGQDVELQTSVSLSLPSCGEVALWSHMTADGCKWDGVVLFEDSGGLPRVIASNTLEIPPLTVTGADPFMLTLADEAVCSDHELCEQHDRYPGRHAIDILQLRTVTAAEAPPLVELAPGFSYVFDNRMSSITEDCELRLAWIAQVWQ
jgi:hypothetical protein